MRKWLKLLIVTAACTAVYLAFNKPYMGETDYNQAEFDRITAFLIYQRQYTQAYNQYCRQQGHPLDRLVDEFRLQHVRQIAEADIFIARFKSEERLAFYQELNRVYAEMQPEMMDQLEQVYHKNRQIYESAGQSFSRYDFCQWLDNHTDELFNKRIE